MPFLDANELVTFAIEQACEENLMERWIASYQYHMTFSEFKNKLGFIKSSDKQIVSKENVEDILSGLCEKFC